MSIESGSRVKRWDRSQCDKPAIYKPAIYFMATKTKLYFIGETHSFRPRMSRHDMLEKEFGIEYVYFIPLPSNFAGTKGDGRRLRRKLEDYFKFSFPEKTIFRPNEIHQESLQLFQEIGGEEILAELLDLMKQDGIEPLYRPPTSANIKKARRRRV